MIEKILNILSKIATNSDINLDTNLLDSGIIDSFAIVDIISEIEKEFDVQINGEDVVPENFNTPTSIMKMLEKYI